MNAISYWEKKHFWNYRDYTIIGCGITGLTASIFIKHKYPKARVTILDRGTPGNGASTKNAGFACFGSLSEILDDLKSNTAENVFTIVKNRYNGLMKLRSLLPDKYTGYIQSKGYEIFMGKEREIYEDCMQNIDFVNKILGDVIGPYPYVSSDNLIDKFGFKNVDHLITNTYEGVIDTGLMMKNLFQLALSEGVEIYNGVNVDEIEITLDNPVLHTNYGEIKTGIAVVATNGFAGQLFPEKDVKPARAQVLITKPIENLKIKGCFHHNCGYNYFRNVDNRILLGGGRDLAKAEETTYSMENTNKIIDYLISLLSEVILPHTAVEIDYTWSGIMGVGNSKEVILERLGPSTIGAFRFGGMGVALGTLIGQKVAAMV